jgi:hypothetical protein
MGLEIRPVTDVAGWLREVTGRSPTRAEGARDAARARMRAATAEAGAISADLLVPRPTVGDVEFLFHLARRMIRDARAAEGDSEPDQSPIVAWVAEGTFDAALWMLGATDVAPSGATRSGGLRAGLRVDEALDIEDGRLSARRAAAEPLSRDYCYLGGASDMVCFARGRRVAYWWAPLPEPLRREPPRDELGRPLP